MKEIYISKNGQQHGPYTIQQLDALLQAEEVTGDDFFWTEGATEWKPISRFPGFVPPPSASLPPPPPSPPQTGQQPQAGTAQVAPPKRRNGCLLALGAVAMLCVLMIGGCLFLGGLFVTGAKEHAKSVQDTTNQKVRGLATAAPSNLQPDGDLYLKFQLGSDFTDLQREAAEKQIKGLIVQWTLTVYEVRSRGDAFRVSTTDHKKVHTQITLFALDPEQRSRIAALRTGDVITIRGYISGVGVGRFIEVDPAIFAP